MVPVEVRETNQMVCYGFFLMPMLVKILSPLRMIMGHDTANGISVMQEKNILVRLVMSLTSPLSEFCFIQLGYFS